MSGAGFWGFIALRWPEVLRLAAEHLGMVAAAMTLAAALGVPLGALLTRRPRLAPWVLGGAATVQTIPGIALLGLLMLLPVVGGIGKRPAVTALFLYSLFAIVENTVAGIRAVDRAVVESGRGMGMTDGQILRMIELPQALPVIVAGVRISAVVCVATATIASFIGAGGLGELIIRGVDQANGAMVAWGALPAIAMALAAHHLLGRLGRALRARANPS